MTSSIINHGAALLLTAAAGTPHSGIWLGLGAVGIGALVAAGVVLLKKRKEE